MFGRKENNKITLKAHSGLTTEGFVEFVKMCNKLATAFPNVTVCVELEGAFIKTAEESDDGGEK